MSRSENYFISDIVDDGSIINSQIRNKKNELFVFERSIILHLKLNKDNKEIFSFSKNFSLYDARVLSAIWRGNHV